MTDTLTSNDIQPLPVHLRVSRPHQVVAVQEAVEAFEAGAQVVFMDAPTGSGKTLIGELIRRYIGGKALYVCSDKALQAQFMENFHYARMLQGRKNYPTQHMDGITCDDCTHSGGELGVCLYCDGFGTCPYQIAKRQAAAAELAVLNTAYMLAETNGGKPTFSRRDLVIIDEADVLESSLMGYVEFEVPAWLGKLLQLQYPRKGVHKPTLQKWLQDAARAGSEWLHVFGETVEIKKQRAMESFVQEAHRVAGELAVDIAADDVDNEDDQAGRWLRDYDTKTLRLRPVMVSAYGTRYLWRHGKKFLIMSATIISAEEMAGSLGLTLPWAEVTVPMTFPVDNRPIVIAPVASMTYKTMQEDATIEAVARAIINIGAKHAGERMLVHTASYKLTDRLLEAIHLLGGMTSHNLYAYKASSEKARALELYLDDVDGCMVAASMSRGVDLTDDNCRVQIIAKVPFPSLGDKQVSARMRLPGGELWYAVQTVRDVVQMTGRAVRSETDWATTYILDAQWSRVMSRNKRLLPAWWISAVDQTQAVAWLEEPTYYELADAARKVAAAEPF